MHSLFFFFHSNTALLIFVTFKIQFLQNPQGLKEQLSLHTGKAKIPKQNVNEVHSILELLDPLNPDVTFLGRFSHIICTSSFLMQDLYTTK